MKFFAMAALSLLALTACNGYSAGTGGGTGGGDYSSGYQSSDY